MLSSQAKGVGTLSVRKTELLPSDNWTKGECLPWKLSLFAKKTGKQYCPVCKSQMTLSEDVFDQVSSAC